MNDARKKLLEKIRAMMNTEGRTEAEMMAFLAKAREMMATYEITEDELSQSEQETATIHKTGMSDPYEIKFNLSMAVGNFTRTRGFLGKKNQWGITFVGLESDVIFATWLLDTLQRFVMRALRQYQADRARKHLGNSNLMSASFVAGCTQRINGKLKELTMKLPAKNKDLIAVELAKHGIVLRKSTSRDKIDENAARMGAKAGNSARFDRPVSSGGQLRLK